MQLVEIQFGIGLLGKSIEWILMAGLNILIAGLYIWIGVQLVRCEKSSKDWAIITNIINSVFIFFQGEAWYVLFPIQGAILLSMFFARQKNLTIYDDSVDFS